MAERTLNVTLEPKGDATVVRVAGWADDVRLPTVQRKLLEADPDRHVVVDLSGLEYICSWGLGLMAEQSENRQRKGTRFRVVQPSGRLRQLFELLQMHLVLHLFNSVEEALDPEAKPLAPESSDAEND